MKTKKLTMMMLAGILSISMLAPQTVLAAGNDDNQSVQQEQKQTENDSGGKTENTGKESTGFDPYLQVGMIEMNRLGALKLPDTMSEVKLSEPKNGNGLLFSGKVGALGSGRISIDREFDFDRSPVGRISVDGLADRGVDVTVNLYLDDAQEPAASFVLGSQMGKKAWANAGDHTLDVSGKKIKGKHRVSFSFEISGKKADKDTDILLRSLEFSENSLPVMYFHIDEKKGTIAAMNGSDDHSVECYGEVDIQVPDGYVSEYDNQTVKSMEDLKLEYIRGRGNSTWGTDKKPYKVKLDKKQDLFGMGANKHWILLANRYDNSLVRNRMTYWLGKELGMEYTPQCIPVEVVMNDTYYGSYLLCEQVRVGESRVGIDDLEDAKDAAKEPEVTGGYLLSMGSSGGETDNDITTEQGASFLIENPSFEDYSNTAQRDYIRTYMQAVENAIFGKEFKDANGKSYTDFLDLDAAANYWWIQEFSANGDAYGSGSTYLYKKRKTDTDPGKLYWGPLWDFDYVAWGDLEYDFEPREGFENTGMVWFQRMRMDPVFAKRIREKWTALSGRLDEITKKGGLLDRYYEELKTSWTYDHEKWGSYGEYWDEDVVSTAQKKERTYKEEIDQLRSWILARKAWVEENLDQLNLSEYTVTFRLNGKVVEKRTLSQGMEIGAFPKAPAKKGYIFCGWEDEYGSTWEEDAGLYDNLTLTAKYVDEKTAVKPKKLYLKSYDVYGYYTSWDEDNVYVPEYTVMPADAVYEKITWTVSDPKIAEVDDKGCVKFLKKGDVKVKGTVGSGVSATYTLHILDEGTELQYPEELVLSPQSVKVTVDGYTQLIAEEEPKPCYRSNLSWVSMDPDIAMVDYNGVVTGLTPGETTIIVMDVDTQLFAQCRVTVKAGNSDSGKKKDSKSKQAKKVQALKKKIAAAKKKKVKLSAKVLKKKKKARLSWKKVKNVSGYEIWRFNPKTGKYKKIRTVKKAKTTKWTSKKKLKKGIRYYYRVRTWTKISKKSYYGKWSKVKILKR